MTSNTIFIFALQPSLILAQDAQSVDADTRLYLTDGSVVMGKLIERSDDLIILRIDHQVHPFNSLDVEKIVTLDSLGSQARKVTVTEFPYISFLGGTVAFGLLSWLQFDTAGDRDSEADLNEENNLLQRAEKLRDDASQARLFGWSAAVLAAGSLGVALIPRRTTRHVFPELTFDRGEPTMRLVYRHQF